MKTDGGTRAPFTALLSGGLDSTAALALERRAGVPALALFFDYGQKAAVREEEAARAIARHFAVELQRIELPWLGAASSSSLIAGRGEPPRASRGDLDGEGPRAVWVENRNGIFIAIGAFMAAERGCERVVVGFNREEAAAFPDNSAEFLRRTNAALELGLRAPVRVESPTLMMTKREIVARALELDLPWHLLWSCYRGGEAMCGECESCLRLARAVGGTAAAAKVRFGKERA